MVIFCRRVAITSLCHPSANTAQRDAPHTQASGTVLASATVQLRETESQVGVIQSTAMPIEQSRHTYTLIPLPAACLMVLLAT